MFLHLADHAHENPVLWIPLVVLAIAILASLALLATNFRPANAATQLFRAVMLLLMLSGAMGSVLHYRANMEFKRDMDPSLAGFALFSSVVQAQSPPALAPAIDVPSARFTITL